MSAAIMQFNEQTEIIKNMQKQLVDAYHMILKDKGISTTERWDFYKNAPSVYKETTCWIETYEKLELNPNRFSWYDDFNVDRYQTVNMVNIVEKIESRLKDYKEDSRKIQETFMPFVNDPNALNELKEEIMEKNIESFVNDW